MIARMWHGWTRPENADAYENLLRDEMFPSIRQIAGARGAYLLRRSGKEEVEFVTITLFDSMDAVRRFAGENYETAVLHPKAHALLSRYDAKSEHYEVSITPE
ncbi:MAG: antibiotic biosynthesis monooxygenase [Terriglobales bacterium]